MSNVTIKLHYEAASVNGSVGIFFGLTEERTEELAHKLGIAIVEAIEDKKINNPGDLVMVGTQFAENDQEFAFLLFKVAGSESMVIEAVQAKMLEDMIQN